MAIDYLPRLQVEISEEHKQKLDRYFGDWGQKKLMVYVILEDLFALIEKFGQAEVIGALASRGITLNEICKMKLKEKHGND